MMADYWDVAKKTAGALGLLWCCNAQGLGDGPTNMDPGLLVLSATTVGPFILTGMATLAPTKLSEESSDASNDRKQVLVYARDDAAAFIATQGKYRGAYLESALGWVREQGTAGASSDIELAHQILLQSFVGSGAEPAI
ncbi:DUF2388 domain-containing protein [Pseudomonas purpurea]|uniref:DUF2388 domain-containing protein n=1 Tax=Pseudomonas purpurea TaxID=3136737 RepID=UPI003264BAC1